jgi:hypothetical protein
VRETKELGVKAAALRIGLIPLLELPLELFPRQADVLERL